MPEHYTRATIEAPAYCAKCDCTTQHRIDSGRRGPCLECIKKLDKQILAGDGMNDAQKRRKAKQELEAMQPDLFKGNL